jgi:hypothetical protein
VGESLRPFHIDIDKVLPLCDQMRVISAIAQQQSSNLIIIFTNLRQAPFQLPNITESGRNIVSVQMNNLEFQDSCILIEKIILLVKDKRRITPNVCFKKFQSDESFRRNLLEVMAIWTGGILIIVL